MAASTSGWTWVSLGVGTVALFASVIVPGSIYFYDKSAAGVMTENTIKNANGAAVVQKELEMTSPAALLGGIESATAAVTTMANKKITGAALNSAEEIGGGSTDGDLEMLSSKSNMPSGIEMGAVKGGLAGDGGVAALTAAGKLNPTTLQGNLAVNPNDTLNNQGSLISNKLGEQVNSITTPPLKETLLTNVTSTANPFQDKLRKNFNVAKEQVAGTFDSLKGKLPALKENAIVSLTKAKNNLPNLNTASKVGLGLVGANLAYKGAQKIGNIGYEARIRKKSTDFKNRIKSGKTPSEIFTNQKNREYRDKAREKNNENSDRTGSVPVGNYNDYLVKRYNNNSTKLRTVAARGGGKTKSNRKTNDQPIFRQSVKRQRKPKTKKCLIEKDNKMYMSFCI